MLRWCLVAVDNVWVLIYYLLAVCCVCAWGGEARRLSWDLTRRLGCVAVFQFSLKLVAQYNLCRNFERWDTPFQLKKKKNCVCVCVCLQMCASRLRTGSQRMKLKITLACWDNLSLEQYVVSSIIIIIITSEIC